MEVAAFMMMMMAAVMVGLMSGGASAQQQPLPIPGFRPPAVPLVMMDPYMNVWLRATNLTDDWATYPPFFSPSFFWPFLTPIDAFPLDKVLGWHCQGSCWCTYFDIFFYFK